MDNTEQRLVTFTGSLRFDELEPQLLHAIKQRFIDTIGCALGAFNAESSVIARKLASAGGISEGVGLLGTRVKSSPELAAFANTAMIRCLDLNDDYFGKDGPHPSDTLGALLAAADSVHADGQSFIVAMAIAYEVLCTLVDAVGLREKGWDYVSFSAIAAALLDRDITAATFETDRFLDADAVALMAKIQLREDPEFTKQYPEVWNCRITAESISGKRHQAHVTYPKGHPKNAFTDKEVEAKFVRLVEPLLGEKRCNVFFDWAWRLEEAADIGEMFQILEP